PEAEAAYQKAIQVAPHNPGTQVALGDFYASTQRLEAALEAYKQAATLQPDALAPKERLAELALRQNKLDEVARYADEKRKIPDSMVVGSYYQGRLALARNQVTEAVTTLKEVVQKAPTWALARYYLGVAYLAQQNAAAAKTAFIEASQLAPD